MPTSLKGLRPAAPTEGSARRAPNAGSPSEDRTGAGPEPAARQPGRGARFLGNAPIRVKVVLITLVPLMAMFLFAGILTYNVTSEAQSAQQVQQLARLGNEATLLVNDLQVERSRAAEYAANPGKQADGSDWPSLKHFLAQTTITNAALQQFLADSGRLDSDTSAPISAALQRIQSNSGTLTNTRGNLVTQARQQGVPVSAVPAPYNSLIDDLLRISDALATSATDHQLSSKLQAASSFSHYKEDIGEEQLIVLQVIRDEGGQFDNTTFTNFADARAAEKQHSDTFQENGTATQQAIRNSISGPETSYRGLSNQAKAAGIKEPINLTAGIWTAGSDKENVALRTVEQKLNADNVTASGDFRDQAIRRTIIVITVALAALVIALLVSLAVARSMVRPLVRLRSSALEVAYQSLPEVVRRLQDADQQTAALASAETKARTLDIRSGDEIGQVAQAFNAVHLEAVRVASEQAQLRQSVSTMFVNLSRRSQLLVDRLIRLIDGLEQGERDPDRLSELFKLDHLATRMRRNDENLLVLAGADAGRRWTRPAPLVDVLRAATAEVEQYTRVKLGSVDDSVEISAAAVNDLVHLVAEVLENATSFSSPRTDVVVDSRRVGDHVVIEIEDQGIGMSREQLAEFNERLAKPPVFDIAVSRMMGLFVVGRLASRHGVKVMLRDATGGGVLAIVTLPASVLHGDQPIPVLTPVNTDEQAGDRPVERVVSERIDRPDQPALPSANPMAPAANAYPATANFGQLPYGNQPPFGAPEPSGTDAPTGGFGADNGYGRDSDFGGNNGFGPQPGSPAQPAAAANTSYAASHFGPLDDVEEEPEPVDPWRSPPPAYRPEPSAYGSEQSPYSNEQSAYGSDSGTFRKDDPRDSQRETFGAPNRTPSSPTGRDPFGAPSQDPFQPAAREEERPGPAFGQPSSPFGQRNQPFGSPAEQQRPVEQQRPAEPQRPAPTANPAWEAPTRQVPIIGDAAAAAATGTHRILADLRPEQPPAEPREPDLTWSGGRDRQQEQPRSAVDEPTQTVPSRPAQPPQAQNPMPALDPIQPQAPAAAQQQPIVPSQPTPASQSTPATPAPQSPTWPLQGPSPLPVRDPFAKRQPQSSVPTAAPAAPTPAAPAPAAAQAATESSRGSAADAMAALRREASADRTGNTGPQKIFRAGPSDPPSSDPTIEMPLPIFEAIESEWFRSRTTAAPRNGSWSPPRVPEAPGARRSASEPDDEQAATLEEIPVSPAVGNGQPFPQSATAAFNRGRQQDSGGYPDVEVPEEMPVPEPVGVGAGRPAPERSATWQSPADTGWRAAQAAAQAAAEPTVESTTKSGLPKRVPMAHFVPGRVEPPAGKKPARPASHRSPEAVRGVLSSYRSGLEQGRQAGQPSRTGTTFAGSPVEQEEM